MLAQMHYKLAFDPSICVITGCFLMHYSIVYQHLILASENDCVCAQHVQFRWRQDRRWLIFSRFLLDPGVR